MVSFEQRKNFAFMSTWLKMKAESRSIAEFAVQGEVESKICWKSHHDLMLVTRILITGCRHCVHCVACFEASEDAWTSLSSLPLDAMFS